MESAAIIAQEHSADLKMKARPCLQKLRDRDMIQVTISADGRIGSRT